MESSMLCVTGQESTLDALSTRLRAYQQQAEKDGLQILQEIRLDALQLSNALLSDDIDTLIQQYREQILLCCRPTRQGGHYRGPESERIAWLHHLSSLGVAYVDLEADISDTDLLLFRQLDATKIVLSWHDFDGIPSNLQSRVSTMAARSPNMIKIAVTVDDPAQLTVLQHASASSLNQPHILIGMGNGGLLSRVRYPAFGSAWTYVAADTTSTTAPGQLTWSQARAYGLPQSSTMPFLALVGGEQIAHSPGPRVYNALFRHNNWPYSYIPVATTDATTVFHLLQQLGALGISVTMPHKDAAFHDSVPDDIAKQVGATNSLRFESNSICLGSNTDVIGLRLPLQSAIDQLPDSASGKTALILGAGGAAKAAVVACQQLSLRPLIAARDKSKFETLGLSSDNYIDWKNRTELDFSILINTTPVQQLDELWPSTASLYGKIVFDTCIGKGASPLLTHAKSQGAQTIAATEMWLHQGAAQIAWITGQKTDPETLRRWL